MSAFPASTILALATQCAPNVAPQTVAAIVRTESRGDPFALNVNDARQPAKPRDAATAIALARRYTALGYSVDLGLGQINSRNMARLGLTWETVLEPCTNIAALGTVLTQNYASVANGRDAQSALRVALSMYNTGNRSRGFRNGYVARVVANAGVADPAPPVAAALLPRATSTATHLGKVASLVGPLTPSFQRASEPPRWDLFARAAHRQAAFTSINAPTMHRRWGTQ